MRLFMSQVLRLLALVRMFARAQMATHNVLQNAPVLGTNTGNMGIFGPKYPHLCPNYLICAAHVRGAHKWQNICALKPKAQLQKPMSYRCYLKLTYYETS